MRRGLVATRSEASEAIAQQRVLVNGVVATTAARHVASHEQLLVSRPASRFVSRGGEKLAAALASFDVDVAGRTALDAGASTGGFTDCLLQHGARRVLALDVGRGQLHERLRSDARVCLLEGTNVRLLDPEILAARVADACPAWEMAGPALADLCTADLSFISLRGVAAPLLACTRQGGDLVVLVKPQFEAGRVAASRGRGVIRNPAIWCEVLRSVIATWQALGAGMMGVVASPLLGPAGNREFFVHLRRAAPALAPPIVDRKVQEAVHALPDPDPRRAV